MIAFLFMGVKGRLPLSFSLWECTNSFAKFIAPRQDLDSLDVFCIAPGLELGALKIYRLIVFIFAMVVI